VAKPSSICSYGFGGPTSTSTAVFGFVAETLAPMCQGKGRDELLWTDAKGEPVKPPASKDSWLSGAVRRAMKADHTFPRVTAHDLRHTYASLAISSGANVLVVQRQLGHRSAAITLDVYADLFDTLPDIVAQAFIDKERAQNVPKTRLQAAE
jgi:site-specific recombinase XerD